MTSGGPDWRVKADAADWASFPAWPDAVSAAYRISNLGPCYFNRDGTMRFDPPATDRSLYGVSYWALDPLACFIEKWGDFAMGIPSAFVAAATLASWTPPLSFRLANVATDSTILGDYGVDLAISHSAKGDYERSQDCASRLRHAGFDGIVWTVRHDPVGQLLGLAVFGPAHAVDEDRPALFPGVKVEEIPLSLIEECERRFHVRVLPSVPLP